MKSILIYMSRRVIWMKDNFAKSDWLSSKLFSFMIRYETIDHLFVNHPLVCFPTTLLLHLCILHILEIMQRM
jgi:hypothetical protein